MRQLALAAISLYQGRISPYKGFCRAYSAHTGVVDCCDCGDRGSSRKRSGERERVRVPPPRWG
jgi:uncharacterized protein